MRTTRTRPPGRHRSPDRLSVPPDAPALVLAVPGAVTESSIEIAAGVIDVATQSCRGVTVRAGFTEGSEESLSAVLADCQIPDGLPAAVVVPLLICPQPDVAAAIAATIAAAPVPALQAEPLGVHPLLAGALHARLAEAGLARGDRIGRISIVTTTTAEGLLVAAHGEDAVAAAGTVAVLLAARLAVPVAAASFGDANSIRNAAEPADGRGRGRAGPGAVRDRPGDRPSRPVRGRGRDRDEDGPAARRADRDRPAGRGALRRCPAGPAARGGIRLTPGCSRPNAASTDPASG